MEDEIVRFVSESVTGIPASSIHVQMGVPADQVLEKVNDLLAKGRLVVMQDASSNEVVLCCPKEGDSTMMALLPQERIVYQLIDQAGNKGIWQADIKFKSQIPATQVTKILRVLERKKLIKAVKSVASKTRKVYMLYDIAPAREVTGGAWYNESELDTAFIDFVADRVFQYVNTQRTRRASLGDMHRFIRESKLCLIDLSVEEVENVVHKLIYDRKLAPVPMPPRLPTAKVYQVVERRPPPSVFGSVPCATCPVFVDCSSTSVVNPRNCEYLDRWLDQQNGVLANVAVTARASVKRPAPEDLDEGGESDDDVSTPGWERVAASIRRSQRPAAAR